MVRLEVHELRQHLYGFLVAFEVIIEEAQVIQSTAVLGIERERPFKPFLGFLDLLEVDVDQSEVETCAAVSRIHRQYFAESARGLWILFN